MLSPQCPAFLDARAALQKEARVKTGRAAGDTTPSASGPGAAESEVTA